MCMCVFFGSGQTAEMSSVDDFGEFSMLVDELQQHSSQSKVLLKILDDTHRVLREIGSASCISESMYQ